jgi:hypothetical protein
LRPRGESSLGTQNELGGGIAWFADSMKFRVQADYFHLFPGRFDAGSEQVRVSARLGL